MMQRNSCLAAALLLALAAVGQGALAQSVLEHREVTEHHASLDPDKRVVVRHAYGAVRLRTADRPQVSVRAHRHLAGRTRQAIQAYLQALKIEVQTLGDRVEVRTERPAGEHKLLTQTTVNLDVTLPPGVAVEVVGSFGDLDAQGLGGLKATMPFGDLTARNIAGDVSLNGRHGQVIVSDVQGDATITHSFGDVSATRVGGSLTVRNQFAQIQAQGVGRRVVLTNRSGPISLMNAGGGAQVTSQGGQIEVSRVQGGLRVSNSSESLVVSEVQGVVVLENANGPVRATQVRGELKVDNRNGPVRIKGVRGSAVVTNKHGLVEVIDITGDCNVHNEFASVTAKNVTGVLEVINAWGLVQADLPQAPVVNEERPWVLQTSHGNVVLGVPATLGCTISVEINGGSIRSDFPNLPVQRIGGRESLQAKINGGGINVNVRVDLGGVHLARRQAAPVRPAKR